MIGILLQIRNRVATTAQTIIKRVGGCCGLASGPQSDADELIFQGVIASGRGMHATLLVPGREVLDNPLNDWPLKLYPGSLNVRITNYPTLLGCKGLATEVAALDRALFMPAFEILQHQFGNNQLTPRPGEPKCGDAQVWRGNCVTTILCPLNAGCFAGSVLMWENNLSLSQV